MKKRPGMAHFVKKWQWMFMASSSFLFISELEWGVWIAEWYHTWLWSLVHCAMPWAESSSLDDDKLFFGPKHNIYDWFYLVCLIWYFYLSVKFVMWIVKQKIENKRNLLKKSLMLSTCTIHLYLISCFWFKKSSGIEPDLVAPMEVASFEVATLIFGQPQIIWI